MELEKLDEKAINRFFAKVEKTSGCWLWTAGCFADGYGAFGLDGRTERANRVSWAIHNERDPGELDVLHKCDTPLCVNPDHLFAGTHQDNVADTVSKGRQARGEKQHLAKLTKDKVLKIRELYASGEYTQREIAEQFNVTPALISCTTRRFTWKHI